MPNLDHILALNRVPIPFTTVDRKDFFFPSFSFRPKYKWFYNEMPEPKRFAKMHTVLDDIRDTIKLTRGRRSRISRLTAPTGELQLRHVVVIVRGHEFIAVNDARSLGIELTTSNCTWLFTELETDFNANKPRDAKPSMLQDDDTNDDTSLAIDDAKKCEFTTTCGHVYWAEPRQSFIVKSPTKKTSYFTVRK